MSADDIARALERMTQSLVTGRTGDTPLALVGIRTRGVPLASRLARKLAESHSVHAPVGALDITLYRDDLSQTAHTPVLRGTDVPFAIDGKEVVLVDDVFFTGRTIRAAMDAVCDLGRPRAIRLAVLVDRGHRELPIRPDTCGRCVTTELNEVIKVRLTEVDGIDDVRKLLIG